MKLLFLALLSLAALAALFVAARAPEPAAAAPAAPAEFGPAPSELAAEPGEGECLRTFDVRNMCCPNCTGKLFASLSAVEGVRAAAVSFEEGTARVICPSSAPIEPLLAALRIDKYDAALRP